jgi:hypothetical protein
MDSITLDEAIADVRSYIDDVRARRWTPAQVTRALGGALSECVEEYAGKGGDRFLEDIDVQTTATTGAVSLFAYDPIDVRAVLVRPSASAVANFTIRRGDTAALGALDSQARRLRLRITRRPLLPKSGTDLLVGGEDGKARAWPAFERWVCMVAGLDLLPKDNDPNLTLMRRESELRAKVLETVRLPSSLPWPREQRHTWANLRWHWKPREAVIELRNASVGGW